jgi:hypothetical protein
VKVDSSACQDVTPNTTFSCPMQSFNLTPDADSEIQECNLTVHDENHGEPWTYRVDITKSSITSVNFDFEIQEQFVRSRSSGAFSALDYPLLILAHATFSLPDLEANRFIFDTGNVSALIKLASAVQCALALCSREYNISVTDGVPAYRTSAPDYGRLFWVNYTGANVSWSPTEDYGRRCWMPASGLRDNAPPPATVTEVLLGVWVNESESAFCGVGVLRTRRVRAPGKSSCC